MQSTNRQGSSYPLLLLTVSFGMVLAPLNSTMLAVALPEIRREFELSHASVAWLISAYLIAMAVAQPVGGRLGDQLGRVRVFRVALVLFLGFSLAAAVAPNFILLVTFRTGQAVVGAAIMPNASAILRNEVDTGRLGEANGVTGSVLSLSAATGPLIGAGLLALGSWRALFLMNVPLVLAGSVCLMLLGYKDQKSALAGRGLNLTGIVLLTALLVNLTFLLSEARGEILYLLAFALSLTALLTLFLAQQARSAVHVAEWRLFRAASFRGATGFIMLSNLVMYSSLLAVPFFVREVQGGSSGAAGGLIGAMSLLMAVAAPVSGRLADRIGRRALALTGGVLQTIAALLFLLLLSEAASPQFLYAVLVLMGLGIGIGTGPATTAAIESASRELAGSAAGTVSMMRYAGSIVATGLLGATLTTESGIPDITVFRLLFGAIAVAAFGATLSAVLIHRFLAEPGVVLSETNEDRVRLRG